MCHGVTPIQSRTRTHLIVQLHIPTLTTERLVLVPPDPSHLAAYLAAYGDAEVMAHIAEPMDANKVWDMMARQIGHWAMRGFGGWSVQLRNGGAIIGRLGLMRPGDNPDVEIGWVLGRESWGKGYATEGAHAALSFGFDVLGAKRIVAHILPGNAGSISVATKLGMRLDAARSAAEANIYVADCPA